MSVALENKADQLLQVLGYESWRPGQREAVVATLEGRDSLIVMPTGGGKSLCYQLPGLASSDLTIVVSPLIALMRDQWERLIANGHAATMICSGMKESEVQDALDMVCEAARIVYCAPERFWSREFLEALSYRTIDLIAVDEAHCVSEWGHDFRPDYLRLPRIAKRLGRPTIMACTATATTQVAAEVAARFGMRDPLQVRSGFDRQNISFDVVTLEGKKPKVQRQRFLETVLRDSANRPAIVYCGTRRDTERVSGKLRKAGFEAYAYHAGMASEDRTRVQDRFMSDGCDVIVATNAFGMGVDKPDVRTVWHMAIPTSVEAYYQEAGRAGRDGKPARAILLAVRADLSRLRRFNQERAGDPALAVAYERGWNAYHVIKSFVYSDNCRRRALLDHFSDRAAGAPLNRCCDVCDPQNWPSSFESRSEHRPGERRRGRRSRRARSGSSAGRRSGSDHRPHRSSGPDARLFEALKTWRQGVAGRRPAYKVASDRALMAIAATRPDSADALLAIRGIGPNFVKRHAAQVLDVIARTGEGPPQAISPDS